MALRSLLRMEIPWEERNVIWKDANGAYTLEEVRTQWDYCMEGYLLAHCLGTKNAEEFNKAHRVFSLRDKLGVTHCTVLTQRDNSWSPYGMSHDIVSTVPMKLQRKNYFILQIRGREDALARWEYYNLIRQWYIAHGGKQEIPFLTLMKAVKVAQDDDFKYHYGYMLDESVNHFNWAWHNEKYRERFKELGLSL